MVLMGCLCLALGCVSSARQGDANIPGIRGRQSALVEGLDRPARGGPTRAHAPRGPLKRTKLKAFTRDASLVKGESYDTVVVEGKGTTLTMTDGYVGELVVKATCHIHLEGGTVQEMSIYDQCTALISGGKTGTVSGYGDNSVTIRGKAEIAALHAYGATQVAVDSDDATVETIRFFTKCGCVDQSQKIKLELSCGQFRNIGTGATEVMLDIAGLDLTKSAYGGTYGYGVVSGRWENGRQFCINLADTSTFSHIALSETLSVLGREE